MESWRFWRRKKRPPVAVEPGSELDALHVQNKLRAYGSDVSIAASAITGRSQWDLWFHTQEAAAHTAEAVRVEGMSAEVSKAEGNVWRVMASTHAMTAEEQAAAQKKCEELAQEHGRDYHGFGSPPPRRK